MAGVKTLQAAIEAILFTMGESVELSKIAKAIEQDEQTTEELLQDLMKKYESKNRGIRIIELDKDRKSTRLNSSHRSQSRMPSSA